MFKRYAVYFLPSGQWGDAGSAWLGWDCRTGSYIETSAKNPTMRPRKYGFHATIKAPFRLASDQSDVSLKHALDSFASGLCSIPLSSLQLAQIGSFFAFTAPQQQPDLIAMSSEVVRKLDLFRAPLTDEDIARRRKSRLTPRQDAQMLQWGYPYVFDDFKFHLTLTGPVKDDKTIRTRIETAFAGVADKPLVLDTLSIAGEDQNGMFHEVHRAQLAEL